MRYTGNVKLQNLQKDGSFALLKLDDAEKLASILGLNLEQAEDASILQHAKTILAEKLSMRATGIILDPYYGFDAIQKKHAAAGLCMRLENYTLEHLQDVPKIIDDWGVASCRNNYATAKLELYYHPSEDNAISKKQLVAELYDFCQYEKIDFVLALRIFNPLGGVLPQEEAEGAQLQAVQELRKYCQLLAIEYPGSSLATATIDSELDIPWVLLSHREAQQEPYDDYKAHLRIALENGASGSMTAEVLLEGIPSIRKEDLSVDWDTFALFAQTTAADRLAELQRIVLENKNQ